MLTSFTHHNWLDHNGKPAGGTAYGPGFTISWQNGPLGRGQDRKEPNGAFVETIIAAAKERIEFYQNSGFDCPENATAIEHLGLALASLNSRTARREKSQTEGTHNGK